MFGATSDAPQPKGLNVVIHGYVRSGSTSAPPSLQVRSMQTFFTHRSVSTFDRVGPFQLTGELVLYFGIALQQLRRMKRTFLKMVGGGLARTTVARLVVKKMFIEYVAQSAEGSRD